MIFKAYSALKRLRVLVVDDDIDSCAFLVVALESYGIETKAAFSAGQALQVFSQFQPHVLVTDIAMPLADGYWLLHQIRALEAEQGVEASRPPVTAIAVTAIAGEEESQRAQIAGFYQWFIKPLDLDRFIHTLTRLVGWVDEVYCCLKT